jgi:hypothetical protein
MGIKPIAAENLLHDINSPWISDATKRKNLDVLLGCDYGEPVKMGHKERNELLDAVLLYYQHHLGLSGNWKSLQVLREVF